MSEVSGTSFRTLLRCEAYHRSGAVGESKRYQDQAEVIRDLATDDKLSAVRPKIPTMFELCE